MKIYNGKMRPTHGYLEGKADAIDTESSGKALGYKRDFLKNIISINQNQIASRLGGDRYFVTRKYDGEYAIILFEDDKAVTVNRSGRVRSGIPCIEEAARLLTAAGLRQAIIPAEIYVEADQSRSRVKELLAVLADDKRTGELKLAAFDILELDHKQYHPRNYEDTHKELERILAGGTLCHPVEMEIADSAARVAELFKTWVETRGAEGLVVRSELPFVYKIKPRHNLDVVVVGFTEGTGEQHGRVRTLLLAMIPREGLYQVVGRTGGGISDKLRVELYQTLSQRIMPSEYIETDSNHVAFRMVEPLLVIEISVNDINLENPSGPSLNTVLQIDKGTFRHYGNVEGMSFVSPVFERLREDKSADMHDVRPSQVENFILTPPGIVVDETGSTDESTLLYRIVYRKDIGDKIMVRKFLVWKTNKEHTGNYLAYVFCYVDFSTGRINPLQREVVVSNSREQILSLCRSAIETQVKKGWNVVDDSEFDIGQSSKSVTKTRKAKKVLTL